MFYTGINHCAVKIPHLSAGGFLLHGVIFAARETRVEFARLDLERVDEPLQRDALVVTVVALALTLKQNDVESVLPCGTVPTVLSPLQAPSARLRGAARVGRGRSAASRWQS